MISEYFPPKAMGGGEISAFLLAKDLVKSNVKVHILTSYFPGLKKEETVDGVIIHRRLKTGSPKSISGNVKRVFHFEKSLSKELKTLQKEEKYDIIHCMNTNSIVAVKIKNLIKKPFVMHVNGPVPFCPKGTLMYKDKEICTRECTRRTFLDCYLNSKTFGKTGKNPLIKYNPLTVVHLRKRFEIFQKLLPLFDYYMPISTYMQQRLVMSGIERKKTKVIYNILELEKFLKLKQPKNKIKQMLYVGTYIKSKGPQIVIEALKRVEEPYEANFYGEGVLKQELIEKSKGLNIKINNKIPYSKIPEVIQKHDIVIVPSLIGEAFGRVALEACAAGKTVIASNIGGIPDIVEDGKTGFLFEAGNVNELKKVLESVLKKKVKLNPEEVKKKITYKFSNKKTVSNVKNIYKALITK